MTGIEKRIKRGVILAPYTTFNIGGPADYFFKPNNINDFEKAVSWALKQDLPFRVLGKGSNVLVHDSGYRGLIIVTANLDRVEVGGSEVIAECGVVVDDLVDYCAERGLEGLEFAAGLPGSVGGALFMNARAYGGEISEVVRSAEILSVVGKSIVRSTYDKTKLDFSYKQSLFQSENSYLLRAIFVLHKGSVKRIKRVIQENRETRWKKGEYRYPNAGCIFKNNYAIGKSTGKLIEELGLKGMRVGDAEVYSQHGNFIINRRNARAEDVYRLIRLIEDRVKEKAGVVLEREIVLIGF